jgi:hypothetical protein
MALWSMLFGIIYGDIVRSIEIGACPDFSIWSEWGEIGTVTNGGSLGRQGRQCDNGA